MHDELRALGLSDKEIDVYLITLKLGAAPVARILRHLQIARPTLYDLLASLSSKGLIASYEKDKKRHYQANEPQTLIEQLADKQRLIGSILPELEALKGSASTAPNTSMHIGFAGVSSLLAKIYDTDEIRLIGSATKAMTSLKHIPAQFARLRAERQIKLRALLEKSDEAMFRVRDPDINKVTEIKYIDEMKDYPALTFITADSVAMVTVEDELIGIYIENKNIAAAQHMLFEHLWETTEHNL